MHLAEGTLPLTHAALWTGVAAPLFFWSVRGERLARRATEGSGAPLAAATSLLFAATLLPVPVPIAGATSHLCLTPTLALLFGPRRLLWPTTFVLLLQALFFAHGGLTTLGANTLTLGLVGPLVAVAIASAGRRLLLPPLLTVGFACALGDLSVYVADAAILALALADTAAPARTFGTVVLAFAPVQLPLALVEAALGVALVRMLASRRPSLLPPWLRGVAAPTRPGAVLPLLLVALLLPLLGGCSYEGIDASVFAETAREGGAAPRSSLVNLAEGELGLASSIIVLFGAGFLAGRFWERLGGTTHDSTR